MKYALESQYIHEMTPFYCPIFNKERAHEIFLKFKLQIMQFTHQPKTSFLIFRIYKIFFYLLSFANFSSSEFAFASYSRTKHFQCFFFSSSLNRLNTLRPHQTFVPIGNAQKLSSGFIQQCCVVELNTAPQHH